MSETMSDRFQKLLQVYQEGQSLEWAVCHSDTGVWTIRLPWMIESGATVEEAFKNAGDRLISTAHKYAADTEKEAKNSRDRLARMIGVIS